MSDEDDRLTNNDSDVISAEAAAAAYEFHSFCKESFALVLIDASSCLSLGLSLSVSVQRS